MPPEEFASDRDWCRAMLPRVSRTFAINLRLLGGRFGEAARIGYLLCRIADALEDSWPGAPQEIRARFATLKEAARGDRAAAERLAAGAASLRPERADVELVAGLPRVQRVFLALDAARRAALAECLDTMGDGMCRYAARAAERGTDVPYLDDERELHDYCWVVAGCVGVMLTRLFELESPGDEALVARRRESAPAVGEALQLTNILLDWPADVRRGRCHVPASWLAEWPLTPADLVGRERPGVRAIAGRLERLALEAIARVPDYVATLPTRHVRYRLFCLWPSLWALASLRHARRDPEFPWGPRRPRLPRGALWGEAVTAALSPRGAALRRLRGAIERAAPAPDARTRGALS